MENVFHLSHLQSEEILEKPKIRIYFLEAIKNLKPNLVSEVDECKSYMNAFYSYEVEKMNNSIDNLIEMNVLKLK
jgi:hypothetical protein